MHKTISDPSAPFNWVAQASRVSSRVSPAGPTPNLLLRPRQWCPETEGAAHFTRATSLTLTQQQQTRRFPVRSQREARLHLVPPLSSNPSTTTTSQHQHLPAEFRYSSTLQCTPPSLSTYHLHAFISAATQLLQVYNRLEYT